jgi:signal transduction histidine kinase/FixJ family two-component response regulator
MDNAINKLNILIVDDEVSIREGSDRILTRMGHRVFTASRGEEGLEVLKNEKIALVLLDLKMPGLDGLEVLQRIQAVDPSILVIVITGYATVETATKAMKLGAYDFIPKPFDPDQLRIVINRGIEKLNLIEETHKLERERHRTLIDLDTEKSRTRTILEFLPNGVLVTNNSGHVVLLNPAFLELAGLPAQKRPGEKIEEYLPDTNFCRLIREISLGCHVDFDDLPAYEFSLDNGKYLLAHGQPVLGEHKECLGAVINIVDITAMKIIDQLKSEFIAKVSHELRSPLATIHEQIAYVLNDLDTSAAKDNRIKNQQILLRAKEKTKGLISMIGDLLDLSRIEEGAICKESKLLQPEQVVTNVVDFLKTQANAKQLSLALKLPDQPLPSITADPLALESILGNLISNAINYTPSGGQIHVIAEQVGINLRIIVKDTGLGIEPQYINKIFDRFYRIKNKNTRFITGTGLGLPIVKDLVDSLGGLIQVESAPGQGSTFMVLLPLKN